jgi:hypothetical protein
LSEKSSTDHQESEKKKSYFFHKIKGVQQREEKTPSIGLGVEV